MFWPPILSLVVLWCTGSDSQPVLTQPPSESVAPGSTVKLPCVLSSGYSISGYVIAWYQQKPGNPPRYLLYYQSDSRKNQGSGVPTRFSGSKDTSANTGYLTIVGAQEEDEDEYYCGSYYSSGGTYQWIFGGGTTLVVSGQPVVAPLVVVYPPSQEEMEKKNKATVVCLLSNFHPPTFTLSWEADGTPITTGVETTKATKVNDKYVASSYLTLSPSEWKSRGSYTCKVTHEGGPNEKSVSHSQCP